MRNWVSAALLIVLSAPCIALGGDENAKLIQQLNDEYRKALAAEPNPQVVAKAAKLLEQSDQGAHLWDFLEGLSIIRANRPKAVSAFQSATRLFSVSSYAGAHTEAEEQAFAAQAIKWWRGSHPRKN